MEQYAEFCAFFLSLSGLSRSAVAFLGQQIGILAIQSIDLSLC